MKLTKKQLTQVDVLVEMLVYGLEQIEGLNECESYRIGGVEVLGHMAACCICQWFTHEGQATGDTIDILRLHEIPDKETLKKRLLKFLKEDVE